jgi:hypothetical protein
MTQVCVLHRFLFIFWIQFGRDNDALYPDWRGRWTFDLRSKRGARLFLVEMFKWAVRPGLGPVKPGPPGTVRKLGRSV